MADDFATWFRSLTEGERKSIVSSMYELRTQRAPYFAAQHPRGRLMNELLIRLDDEYHALKKPRGN